MNTIPGDVIASAVRALLAAARFAEATALLDAAGAAEHPALVLARIEVTLARDWHHGEVSAAEPLHAARAVIERAGDAEAAWMLDFLSLKRDYNERLLSPSDDRTQEELVGLAGTLRDTAPDPRCRGWAEFYLGVIADNFTGRRDTAPAHYRHALAAAARHGDDLLVFETLRHLGDHAHDDGDQMLAREQWERSARHAARAGYVAGALSQQLLLAVLARDRGDEPGAVFLAGEVARWTGAIGARRTEALATGFLAGVDPTRPPFDSGRPAEARSHD
ncbi:MAG TPA: hypothetical protein VFV67_26710 [Actinophytocola sp.]|uniref:hypothetical protein n=1 Tax=Actinophytocola sp. TaxID=1872138 RepID=UPI002DB67BFB|nr:hypothetical protein [Actinophytocola sp.]HEU5474255.1 hypothetical protein [Actinophytocola sp.]